MAKDSFIDWDQLAGMSKNPDYGSIIGMLSAPQKSYRDVAGAEIMPLLQPGVDPYMQQAINEIIRQGKESKARSLADVSTSAQARGLTGSSIESGDIAQTSYQQELGQQGQITNILAQDAAAKKQQMIQFLTQAYGMDFQRANQLSDTLAQVMGQELGRRQDLSMFERSLKAQKEAQPGWLESLLPSLIGAGGTVGGAAILASDRRLKRNISRIGEIKTIPVYVYEYDREKIPSLPEGLHIGVMADEVKHIPGAVVTKQGYDYVDYGMIFK